MKARKIKQPSDEEAEIDALEAVQWLNEARKLLADVLDFGETHGPCQEYLEAVRAFLEKTK